MIFTPREEVFEVEKFVTDLIFMGVNEYSTINQWTFDYSIEFLTIPGSNRDKFPGDLTVFAA